VPTWLIIVLAVLAVLALGGALARARQLARSRDRFDHALERVNEDLAQAAAHDRGWNRDTLEDAARRILAGEGVGDVQELHLVEVLDRPGTDKDLAVFRVPAGAEERRLTLGRRDGDWVLERLQ
jgi:hypothetical protein